MVSVWESKEQIGRVQYIAHYCIVSIGMVVSCTNCTYFGLNKLIILSERCSTNWAPSVKRRWTLKNLRMFEKFFAYKVHSRKQPKNIAHWWIYDAAVRMLTKFRRKKSLWSNCTSCGFEFPSWAVFAFMLTKGIECSDRSYAFSMLVILLI